ncbi:unnamed protein product [Chilo suppressalis]|uniref:Insulin-like domain-containing protein n=1 Tax=Chilo suppressalis TaxID=168631 RepID=A0ABN8LB83_CHISP|nr:unnamed protein product [Chilo suppressalis]
MNADSNEKVFHITDKITSCSSYLSNLINLVCNNSIKIIKRDTSLLLDRLTPRSIQEYRKKQRVLARERWRRVRRQVASECCDQACTIGQMIKYCPEDARLVRERPEIFE